MRQIRIAARQSDLARLQAYEVGKRLLKTAASRGIALDVQYSFRSSLGDQRADDPLWKMPEKGVFTEDFVHDLQTGAVDLVVHSWKDLPIQERAGTLIAATLQRADARDVLLVRRQAWTERQQAFRLGAAPKAFRVLTSSPRRGYCLTPLFDWLLPWSQVSDAKARPAVEFVPVRGNIATRVDKIQTADALVVAKAALDRLLMAGEHADVDEKLAAAATHLRSKLLELDFVVLPLTLNPTAAAQGALAVEVRKSDAELLQLCAWIDSSQDRADVEEERRVLASYGGGCHQKIGVTRIRRESGTFTFLRGLTDGGVVLKAERTSGELRLEGKKVWRGEGLVAERTSVADLDVASIQAKREVSNGRLRLFVARADAWREAAWAPKDIVWTAGLATWRRLTEQGVWVHGSSEGLGEVEDARLDALIGHPVSTISLTHEDSARAAAGGRYGAHAVGTYAVRYSIDAPEKLQGHDVYLWRSRGQIAVVQAAFPELFKPRRALHAVGPGKTLEEIRQVLAKAGWSAADLESDLLILLEDN